jgi:hypothetical protein
VSNVLPQTKISHTVTPKLFIYYTSTELSSWTRLNDTPNVNNRCERYLAQLHLHPSPDISSNATDFCETMKKRNTVAVCKRASLSKHRRFPLFLVNCIVRQGDNRLSRRIETCSRNGTNEARSEVIQHVAQTCEAISNH